MRVERLEEHLLRVVAPNGLRVLTESLPAVRSTAIGVWVRSASAHEPRERMGVSHLLEHMVFKGTERRSAHDIALALESRGGMLDAFTSRDHTVYQAHVLDEDLPAAVDVLTDLVRRPLLRSTDLQLERNVVLEEIHGVQDTPDDLVFELHANALWGDHPYGYSILGTPETVQALTSDDLRLAHTAGYYPGNCVIAVAGSFSHDGLMAALDAEGWFEEHPLTEARPAVSPTQGIRGLRQDVERETQQVHVVFGTDTMPSHDPRRYALGLITTVFGGGMSSRLFQRVREELGLAYAVYAFQQFFQQTGSSGVYVASQPETAEQAIDAILAEYRRLAESGLDANELAVGKRQLKGQIMLSLESTTSRMHRLASSELGQERYRPLDEILRAIDAVTPDEVRALAREFFAPERQTIVTLGQ